MPVPAEKFGKYTLLHQLAVGGMGEIWLARQVGPAGFVRFTAIKRLLPNLAESEVFVQMFQDEARLVAQLTHPGICQVYEFDRIGNHYYLAMEYLHGESLASILDRSVKEGKPLSEPVIAYIAAQALEGLHFAHEARDSEQHSLNLVHRDISPSNIFVTYDGQVKLLDFGIAKAARRTIHTQVGSIKGKYGYIAPEVYKGQSIDRRVDLFSMGVVLWEMLTRRRLYNRGADYEILRAVVEEAPPDPREVDTAISPILAQTSLKALDKFPSERFQTALEMRRAISGYLRSLHDEMDAQRISAMMTDLYGQIWIDLRSSVLESFKGGESVDHADALNPTLTDSRIIELTQLAAGSFSRPVPFAKERPFALTPELTPAKRVNSGESPIPAVAPTPRRSRTGAWVGAVVAVTVLVSVAALAARHRAEESPTAEPAVAVEAPPEPAPTEPPPPASAAHPRPLDLPAPTSLVANAKSAEALSATDSKLKPAGHRHASRATLPTHPSGRVINPDELMAPWDKR